MTNKIQEDPFTTAFDSPEDVGRSEFSLIDGINGERAGLSMAGQDEMIRPSGCPAGFMEVEGKCVPIS